MRERLLDVRLGGLGLAFLNQRARDVHPAVGIPRLGFGDALEGVLGAFEIALEQQADAPVVPALAILLADDRLPLGARRAATRRTVRRDDRQVGNAADLPETFAGSRRTCTRGCRKRDASAGPARLRRAGVGELRVVVGELAVVELRASSVIGPSASLRDVDAVVDGVGGAGRDQADVEACCAPARRCAC